MSIVATDKESVISSFVSRLERKFSETRADDGQPNKQIDRAGRAILKRNAGKTIAEAHRALAVFMALNPPIIYQELQPDGQECAFLVATLYCSLKGRKGASIADEMRYLKQDGFSGESLERRMAHLLECRSNEELSFRLRQAAKLLESQRRGLDWRRLMHDLKHWHDPERKVQKRWANAFFRTTDLDTDVSDTTKGTED